MWKHEVWNDGTLKCKSIIIMYSESNWHYEDSMCSAARLYASWKLGNIHAYKADELLMWLKRHLYSKADFFVTKSQSSFTGCLFTPKLFHLKIKL